MRTLKAMMDEYYSKGELTVTKEERQAIREVIQPPHNDVPYTEEQRLKLLLGYIGSHSWTDMISPLYSYQKSPEITKEGLKEVYDKTSDNWSNNEIYHVDDNTNLEELYAKYKVDEMLDEAHKGLHIGDCTAVAATCCRCLSRSMALMPYDGPPNKAIGNFALSIRMDDSKITVID